MERNILRGDMYYADLNPVIGSEQGGNRPVLIIQNDIGNRHSPTVIVAAITGKANQKAKLPTHCYLEAENGLEMPSIVLLEQIRTIDKQRLSGYVGTLSQDEMKEIDNAIIISLGVVVTTDAPMVITLCHVCSKQFYNSNEHTIKRLNNNQITKESCMYCNIRTGFDFLVMKKGGCC